MKAVPINEAMIKPLDFKPKTMSFIPELESTFEDHRNPELAFPMEKYMKNKFSFFGIKTDKRRNLFHSVWKYNQEEVDTNSREIALALYAKKEREFHYCAVEILMKNLKKNFILDDILWIEKIIVTNSWWDTVDTISKYILGIYLQQFPQEIPIVIARFSNSENMWLNRAAILFQLSYKEKTNAELLFSECVKHSHSKEFFIQKAIGWALRDYGRFHPEAVKKFVKEHSLKPLSQKEALKNIS